MNLHPVPQSRLPEMSGIFSTILPELKMEGKITVDQFIENLDRGYEGRYMGLYVDNMEDPSHLIVLANYPGMIVHGFVCAVVLVYSKPDKRGDKEAIAAFHRTAEAFATFHGSSCIIASSWKYQGSRPIDPLWLSRGYEVQENVYVKYL